MKLNNYSTILEVEDIKRGHRSTFLSCRILKHIVEEAEQSNYDLELPNSHCNNLSKGDIFRTSILSTDTLDDIARTNEIGMLNTRIEVWNNELEAWDLIKEM